MNDPWDNFTLDNSELWQISHDNVVKENEALRQHLTSLEYDLEERDKRIAGLKKDFLRGYLQALYDYAYMKDGIYYVGSCGTTLKQAQEMALTEPGR